MAKFDPERHRVVAVPFRDDDPERGQHFHVDLDALVDAAREAAAKDVSSETLGDDQGLFFAKRMNAIDARLTELEALPHVSQETLDQLNDAFNSKISTLIERQVNAALGDLRSRIVTIERKSTSLTTVDGDPDGVKLTKLAGMLQMFGEMLQESSRSLDERLTAVEQMYAELAELKTELNVQILKISTKLYKALAALEHDEEAA